MCHVECADVYTGMNICGIATVAGVEAAAAVPGLLDNGEVTASALQDKEIYYGTIKYQTWKEGELDKLLDGQSDDTITAINSAKDSSGQKALADMAIFPAIMLVAYIMIFLYFRSKGGYKPLDLTESDGGSSEG